MGHEKANDEVRFGLWGHNSLQECAWKNPDALNLLSTNQNWSHEAMDPKNPPPRISAAGLLGPDLVSRNVHSFSPSNSTHFKCRQKDTGTIYFEWKCTHWTWNTLYPWGNFSAFQHLSSLRFDRGPIRTRRRGSLSSDPVETPSPRSVLTNFRVRTDGAQGNQVQYKSVSTLSDTARNRLRVGFSIVPIFLL